jgi:hypothetical protein
MLLGDPALRLLPLEKTTEAISIHDLSGMSEELLKQYFLQRTAPKRQHMDGFLHICSNLTSATLER